MSFHLYDSARREIVEFHPLEPGKVSIYVCGPTVQSAPHLGHMRSRVNFDVLRRWLEFTGNDVTLVVNVTDIDDKILAKAAEAGRPWWAHAYLFEAAFREAFEALGGLVVVSSMVGNNTHRMLDLDEFRGFTLHSATAPLVFVNGHDTKRGQVFSLLHEFAHVWRGDSGVSAGGEPLAGGRTSTERWCDHVAAETAVPADDLRNRYRRLPDVTAELDRLGDFYRCSTLVVLIRLRDLGLVPTRGFQDLHDDELGRLLGLMSERAESSGGTFYNNQPYRIGETLSRALIRDTHRGRTPLTEALGLMSFKSAPVFDKYAEKLGES